MATLLTVALCDAQPVAAAEVVSAGSASGYPGTKVAVSVSLMVSGGAMASAAQNDLGFDPSSIAVAATPDGQPDCIVGGGTGKMGAFAFEPFGCSGLACTSIRALLFGIDTHEIPNGILYTCNVEIAPAAVPGLQPLDVFGIVLSTPTGEPLSDASGVDGAITILDRCGNGTLDVGEQCDDGNQTAGDVCPATCRYTAGSSAIRGNAKRPGSDKIGCQVEWYVVDPSNPLDRFGLPSKLQKCKDQDPTCDFDPTPGRCRFEVVACVSNDDPALACTPDGISTLIVRGPRPQSSSDPAVQAILTADAAAVGDAFQHLLDPANPAAGFTATVPLDASRRNLCSAPFAIDALVRPLQHGSVKITTRSKDHASPRPRTDLSRLQLTCQ